MNNALHRHDISDASWELIAPHLPGKEGDWGGFAKHNRQFINAVIWIFSVGALARPAAGVRQLEQRSQVFCPVAGQRSMGASA